MSRSVTISTVTAVALGAAAVAAHADEARLLRGDEAPDARIFSTGNSSSNSSSNSSAGRRTLIETYRESGDGWSRRERRVYRYRDAYDGPYRGGRRWRGEFYD